MKASFHRGLLGWVAEFELEGRPSVAYLERETQEWRFAKERRLDQATRSQIQVELTEKLREWLKTVPK